MPKIQTRFKNSLQASHVARQIAQNFNRGSAIERHLETVLNSIRDIAGIKSLKQLSEETIQVYTDTLQDKLNAGELSRVTTSSYISAMNDIIKYMDEHLNKNLETVSAKEIGLSRGEFKFHNDIVPQEAFTQFKDFLEQQGDIRSQALQHSLEIQRELGLRLRESIRIQKTSVQKALQTGVLTIGSADGTKNGQRRSIEIKYNTQRQALSKALEFQKEHGLRSLIPQNKTTQQQINYAENIRRTFVKQTGVKLDYHGNRKYFLNEEARKYGLKYSSEEGGHHRKDVMRAYTPPA